MDIFIIFSFFLGFSLSVWCHEDEIFTMKYNNDNFSQEISKKNHFIMFYAPWCGHCKKFAPIWEQLAEMLNQDDNNIRIAMVDCTISSEICAQQDITGYPTLKFFKQTITDGVRFRGTRDLPSLTNFINEQLREDQGIVTVDEGPQQVGGLFELIDENFDKHVSKGKHFIKFYAPWCGHCQILAPIWEQLAKSLIESDVNIGKIDCTVYRSVCNNFDVKGYPTLIWIEEGKKLDKYQGSRKLNELQQYVNNMLGYNKEEMKEMEHLVPDKDDAADDELSGDNFKNKIENGLVFVKFFAPWCGHCKRLSPIWNILRQKFSNDNSVKIFKVDCNSDVNKELCNDKNIEGFPTLILYKDGTKISEYSGSRSLEDLTDFINKHLGHDEL